VVPPYHQVWHHSALRAVITTQWFTYHSALCHLYIVVSWHWPDSYFFLTHISAITVNDIHNEKHSDSAYRCQGTSYQCHTTDPDPYTDRHQNLTICSLAHCQPSLKTSYKSVPNFFCAKLLTDRQTDRQTNRQRNNDNYTSSLAAVINLVTVLFTRGCSEHFSNISSYDHELWPVTLTFKLRPDSVKVNQHAKQLSQRYNSKHYCPNKHTHTPDWPL